MSAVDLQFIDTNILIYAYDRSAGMKHEQARTVLSTLWRERTGCLSIQVLQEFYANATRKVAEPLSTESAAQIIAGYSAWHVHRPGINDILSAIRLQARFQLSFWDAMILASARQLGCGILWTEDLSADQSYAGVIVRNPFSL